GNRIFRSLMPKETDLPAVVFYVAATTSVYSMQGASGLRAKRVAFDSYARKYSDAVAVSDAIRGLLQSFKGSLPDGTLVNGCIVQNDMDFPYEAGTSGYVHRRLLEVEIWHNDSVKL